MLWAASHRCVDSPLKKTVAFTRLAEGLDDLCDTPPTGSVDIPHPSYKGKCVAIMNFAEVMTQETCEAFINDFAAESKESLAYPCCSFAHYE